MGSQLGKVRCPDVFAYLRRCAACLCGAPAAQNKGAMKYPKPNPYGTFTHLNVSLVPTTSAMSARAFPWCANSWEQDTSGGNRDECTSVSMVCKFIGAGYVSGKFSACYARLPVINL
eukprot:1156653-Pelagomonas_calceolata.AAC.1